jgi:transcriptional regulator GlxA family with amidase domain
MPTRTVCILLYPGCQGLDVTGPYEVFAGANKYLSARGKPSAYKLVLAAKGRRTIATESGLRLLADIDLAAVHGPLDTLIAPGGDGSRHAEQDVALLKSLRRLAKTSRRVAGVCTGAFLLAAAGLLDGRRATTHWSACKELARRYPRVSVDSDPIYVRDGRIYTSAGVTAGIDLSLALVEADLGREIALTIARWLVLFLRRPANQRQFSAQLQGQMAERDSLRHLQGYIADHLSEDLNVERLAELAAMSPRNFARCFTSEVGLTPARYIAQLRLEAARRLLEESRTPIEAIASTCGFGTPETLRRTFLRELKTAPREYRHRFFASPQTEGEASVPIRRAH